jgi:hypothetical protein
MNEVFSEFFRKMKERSTPPEVNPQQLQTLQELHEFILQQEVTVALQAFKLELANNVLKCKDYSVNNGLHEQIQTLSIDDVQQFYTAVLNKVKEIFTQNNVLEEEAYDVAERRHKQAISDAAMRAEGHYISFSRTYLSVFRENHGHAMLELACLLYPLKLKLVS